MNHESVEANHRVQTNTTVKNAIADLCGMGEISAYVIMACKEENGHVLHSFSGDTETLLGLLNVTTSMLSVDQAKQALAQRMHDLAHGE